jgi:hypothetical protein
MTQATDPSGRRTTASAGRWSATTTPRVGEASTGAPDPSRFAHASGDQADPTQVAVRDEEGSP